jgi:hypothetical protein
MPQKSVVCTVDPKENDAVFLVSHEGDLEPILEQVAASLLTEWKLGKLALTFTPAHEGGQHYVNGYELLNEYVANPKVRLYFEAHNCVDVTQGYDLVLDNYLHHCFWGEVKPMPTTEQLIREYVQLWIAEKTDDVSDISVNIARIDRMSEIQEQLDNQHLMPTELISMTATVLTAGMPMASGAPAHECALCGDNLTPNDDVVRTYIGDCHESCANQVEDDGSRIVL